MTGIIIQARLGSTRLSRKALLPIAGKPSIRHTVEKCLETGFPVVLAVPEGERQEFKNAIGDMCSIYEGHPTDVLDRYYEVAKAFNFDPIVRITGDCPLVDPDMIKAMIGKFEGGYLSNCQPVRTVPKGMDIEIFDFSFLELVYNFVHDPPPLFPSLRIEEYKEHVTQGFYEHFIDERIETYAPSFPDSWNVSIDTQEDYERVKAMIEEGKYSWLN